MRQQLLFSPIAIAHIQETLVEAFMCGRLLLDVSEVRLLIIERDVPCGAIAARDFKETLSRLIAIMANPGSRRAPHFYVDVLPSERFEDSPLTKLPVEGCRLVSRKAMQGQYDMVLEVSVLDEIVDSVYTGRSPLWCIGWHAQQSYAVEDVDLEISVRVATWFIGDLSSRSRMVNTST